MSFVEVGKHNLAFDRELLYRFVDSDDSVEVCSDRARSIQFPEAAVDAARRKANSYHCREAFFAKPDKE